MSWAVITKADYDNNSYKVSIPGISPDFQYPAQCITYRELRVNQTVELIDINNWPPYKALQIGNLRVRDRSYGGYSRWYKPSEIYPKYPANLAYGFIYSSGRNRRWQEECPLYRKGIVQSIQSHVYMTVRVEDYGFYPDRKCPTDYYSCGTEVFSVDDEVVIRFHKNTLSKPTVIGFWDDPQPCLWEGWDGISYSSSSVSSSSLSSSSSSS